MMCLGVGLFLFTVLGPLRVLGIWKADLWICELFLNYFTDDPPIFFYILSRILSI